MENLTPKQIVAELDKYIIGQGDAKRNVAIALRNRWRRMNVQGEIKNDIISLQMINVNNIQVNENSVFMHTGTQHHVELVDDLNEYPVFDNGKKIRNSYQDPGSNVNFVQQIDATSFRVRTYEKGVENETLACGTGVTAVALAMHKTNKTKSNVVSLSTEGGHLEVSFENEGTNYTNVFLKGPAQFVFEGNILI